MTDRIIEFRKNQRNDKLVKELLDIWEDSVRATHLFLSDSEILHIKNMFLKY